MPNVCVTPILSSRSEDKVLPSIQKRARPTTTLEQQAQVREVDDYGLDTALLSIGKAMYPELAARVDVGPLSVLNLVDRDE